MKRAFTLVELSIVLVIIGLLTAGVVGGASLVESAKQQKIVGELSKYKTAIKAFQLEYNALPGDMTDATLYWGKDATACNGDTGTAATDGRQTCNGDGDGGFDYVLSSQSNAIHEPWRTWQHLSNSGIIQGNYTGTAPNFTGCTSTNYCTSPGVNAPKNEFGAWTIFQAGTSSAWGWTGKNTTRNILALGNPLNLSGNGVPGVWYGMALTTKQQKSIDTKTDDGVANSGAIVNMSGGTYIGNTNPNCTTLNGTTLSYNLTYTTVACNILYDID